MHSAGLVRRGVGVRFTITDTQGIVSFALISLLFCVYAFLVAVIKSQTLKRCIIFFARRAHLLGAEVKVELWAGLPTGNGSCRRPRDATNCQLQALLQQSTQIVPSFAC